jgi:hypothetical protein
VYGNLENTVCSNETGYRIQFYVVCTVVTEEMWRKPAYCPGLEQSDYRGSRNESNSGGHKFQDLQVDMVVTRCLVTQDADCYQHVMKIPSRDMLSASFLSVTVW